MNSSFSSSSTSNVYNFTTSSLFDSSTGLDEVTQLRQNIQSEPFLQFNGLTNGTWLSFFVIAVASSRLGTLGPKIGLPLITAYMVVGCICGPYVLNLVTTTELPDIAYITQIALSFIAFSAGSELYLPELRSLFRKILYITSFNALYTYIICACFIYGLASAGLVSWMDAYLGGCGVGISLIAASIMVARSPASAIAVVRELRAKGPVTSTMRHLTSPSHSLSHPSLQSITSHSLTSLSTSSLTVGVTVVGDVVVLVLFTLSSSITLAQCSGAGFEGGAFIITILTLMAAVGLGYLLGGLLIFLLWVPYAKYTILPLGFFIFVFSDWFAVYSIDHYGVSINFDSLLICITAGYVATNQSRNRTAFLKLLGNAASYIFIPFFTKVGVELNLTVLIQSLPFAILVFLMRGICIFFGSFTGGSLTGGEKKERYFMWMTMLAQAGVSLGLASEVAVKFPDWGRNFQTTIIAVVLLNQFAGPVLCKIALRDVFKEAGKMKEGEDAHGGHSDETESKVKRVLIVGLDAIALETAQRLLDRGYAVTLMDEKRKIGLANVLESEKGDLVKMEKGEEGSMSEVKKGMKKKGYSELDLEQVENERQESVLVEEEEGDERRVEVDEEREDEEEKEEEERGGLTTEKRIETIVLPSSITSSSSPDSLIEALTPLLLPLLSSPLSQLHSALVFLPSDPSTLTVSTLLTAHFHLHTVLARLHNSTWASHATSLGISPLLSSSLTAHVACRTLMEGEVDLIETDRVGSQLTSLPHVMTSFIQDGDEKIWEWALGEERDEWMARHPAMTEEGGASVSLQALQQAMTGGVSMNVVPHALRDHYLDRIHAMSNAEDEGDVKGEMREATEAFLSPSAAAASLPPRDVSRI